RFISRFGFNAKEGHMKTRSLRLTLLLAALIVGNTINSLASAAQAQEYRIYRIEAFGVRSFTINYERGETAEVGVVGDGDNVLNLYVYDQFGRLLAYDEDNSDKCYVRWTPSYTGRYVIKIINRGRVYSDFALIYR